MSSFLFRCSFGFFLFSYYNILKEKMTPPMMLSSFLLIYIYVSRVSVYMRGSSIYIHISVYESIRTGVEHDNNVDDLLIVHIHRHQLLSKREKKKRREREKKTYTMVTQMCRLSVLFRSKFFLSLSPSRYSILFLLSSLDARTRQQWRKKKKGKESTYMYVYMHTYIVLS